MHFITRYRAITYIGTCQKEVQQPRPFLTGGVAQKVLEISVHFYAQSLIVNRTSTIFQEPEPQIRTLRHNPVFENLIA